VSLTIAAFISLQIGNFFLIASVLFLFVTSRQLVRSSRMKSKRLKDSGHEFFRLPDLANQDLRDLIKLLPKDGDAKDQIKRVLASQSKYGYDKSEWQAKHNTLLITLYIMLIVFALAMTTIVEGTVLESMRMRIAEGTKWKVTLSITALSGIIAQLVLFIRKRRR
jgi:hypothetical protein